MLRTHQSRYRAAVLIGVLVVAPVLFTSLTSAQGRQFSGPGLTVYADQNFSGRTATFRDDVSDLRSYRLNDEVTSLQVARGETWEVCEDVNFSGRCQIVNGDANDLRGLGWSDRISSARRVRANRGGVFSQNNPGFRSGIELYSDAGFNGRRIAFDEAIPNLRDLNFNDRAMSIRLGRNETWEVCADANYRNCRVIGSDVTDLSRVGMSTRISSLRPLRNGQDRGFPGNGRFDRGARLFLYDQRNFRGQPYVVDNSIADFRGFNDRAESVRVEGGSWQVCSEAGFRGRCTVITGEESDLGRLGFRNNVGSARPVRQ